MAHHKYSYFCLYDHLTASICQGETYSFNGQDLTTSGNYTATLTSSLNCDSIVNLELTVNSIPQTDLSESICQGASFSFNGQDITTSGNYTATLTSSLNCDSIVNLELTVNPIYQIDHTETICQGESYSFDGQDLTTSGSYTTTLTSSLNCDSIVNLELVVNQESVTNLMETICQGESYLFDGESLTNAGVYHAVLQNEFQCDSTVNLMLEIEDCGACPDEDLTVIGNPIAKGTYTAIKTITSASEIGDTVTFLAGESIDLQPGFYGASGTVFLAEIAEFVCEEPNNSLTDQPTARVATSRSTTNNNIIVNDQTLKIQPNPFHLNTQIAFTLSKEQDITLALHSIDGQELEVIAKNHLPKGTHTIPYQTNNLNGVYMVVLQTEQGVLTQKVISLK